MRRPPAAARALLPLLAGALATLPPPARAEEPEAPGAVEVRFLEVGALARGARRFFVERGPFGPSADQVNDEMRPLYGGEGEEAVRPYGSVDELIERLKEAVPSRAWDREGTSIHALSPARVVVRGPASLLDPLDRLLGAFEADALRTVVLDVVACAADAPASAGAAGGFPVRAEAVLACARACGFVGQQVTAFSGGHRAYLADYDVEVATDAKGQQPIVGVQPDGLAVQATASIAGEAVVLDLQAWLARVEAIEARGPSNAAVEAIRVRGSDLSARSVRLAPGAWARLPASADVDLLVRATVEPVVARAPSTALPAVEAGSGEPAWRTWGVEPLARPRRNARGPRLFVAPSHYTPPEPPELAEPSPALAIDHLVELLRSLAPEAVWGEEGLRATTSPGRLHLRVADGTAAAVDRLLAELERRLDREVRVDATVVSLPRAAYAAISARVAEPGSSVRDALAALDGARVEGRTSVRVALGGRDASFTGTERSYVGGFDVEIAEKAVIGNPSVLRAHEGLALDVDAAPAAGGAAVACEVRCDRAVWRATRAVASPFGEVQLPDVGYQRVRGSFVAAPGTSRLLSLGIEGERLVAVVLDVVAP